MKTVVYKKLFYALSYMFCALFIEFVTFNVMGLGAFPEMFVFDLMFIGLIALIIFIIPSFKIEAIIIILLLVLQSALSFVNQAMHNDSMLRTIFTFDQLNAAGAAAGVFSNDYVSWPFLVGLLCVIIAECAFLIFLRRIKAKYQFKLKVQFAFIMAFLFLATGIGSSYGRAYSKLYSPSEHSEEIYLSNDDKKLFSEADYSLKLKAFKKYGTFAFYYKNLVNTLKEPENIDETLKGINNYLADGIEEGLSVPSALNGVYKDNNLIMIMMESAEWYGIDKTLTPTLYDLAYNGITCDNYISKNKTNQSEAISILGSYPTKTDIQAELKLEVDKGYSSYTFSIPYVLKNEGYTTSYFHNNVSDFYNRITTHKALGFDNLYFWNNLTLNQDDLVDSSKIFVDKKYKTSVSDFYDFESDYVFLDGISNSFNNKINPSGKFMSFYTTMSMHGDYNDIVDFIELNELTYDWDYLSNDVENQSYYEKKFDNSGQATNVFFCKYYPQITKDFFKNKFYDSLSKLGYLVKIGDNIEVVVGKEKELHTIYLRYKQYQAACMDLDRGLESLIKNLIANNQLKDTTILLFSDHDSYYHNQNFTLRGYNKTEFYNIDLYKVPYILYDGSRDLPSLNYISPIEKKIKIENSNGVLYNNGNGDKIDKWISGYDTVPTLLDLFGYKFNRNLYQGISAFSNVSEDERSVFYSFESGVMNKRVFRSGEGLYYYVDENKDLYIKELVREGFVYTVNSAIPPTEDKEKEIDDIIVQFELQCNNFSLVKQGMLEGIYDFKFFSFKNNANKNLEYADISKSIVKV